VYIFPNKVNNYIKNHTTELPDYLQELERETHLKLIAPQMISGRVQGRFLKLFSELCRPNNILEIGTYSGYSAICMAYGLQEKGKLITIDINEELERIQSKYFEKSGLADKIESVFGNALDLIPKYEDDHFDLVFMDADKSNYCNYYNLVLPKMKKGAFLLADNVLWDGKVFEEVAENDKDTKAIIEFNTLVQNDDRVENVLLFMRDGMMLVRKV